MFETGGLNAYLKDFPLSDYDKLKWRIADVEKAAAQKKAAQKAAAKAAARERAAARASARGFPAVQAAGRAARAVFAATVDFPRYSMAKVSEMQELIDDKVKLHRPCIRDRLALG